LIVEVLSPSTRNRDPKQKRTFYADARVTEYWIIDPEQRTVTVIARNEVDRTARDTLICSPPDVDEPLEIRLAEIFIDSD
jgi:Uma2 family endonuclease